MRQSNATRTQETTVVYRRVFLRLYGRAQRERGRLSLTAFVGWLAERRPTWARRTWWFYKAACLEGIAHLDTDDREQAHARLASLTAEGALKRSTRTSAQKAKRLGVEDLAVLHDCLMNAAGRWAAPAARWLIAGHATGLRPKEWVGCEWADVDGAIALRVRNGKATNGRAHGAYRHLLLHGFDEPTLAVIRRHLADIQTAAAQGDAAYFHYYDNCRDALYRAARACFPERKTFPTLYSARHQFAADAKRLHGARVAGALMGHITARTSQRQYAQARVGEARGGVAPPMPGALAEEINRVQPDARVPPWTTAIPAPSKDDLPDPSRAPQKAESR